MFKNNFNDLKILVFSLKLLKISTSTEHPHNNLCIARLPKSSMVLLFLHKHPRRNNYYNKKLLGLVQKRLVFGNFT